MKPPVTPNLYVSLNVFRFRPKFELTDEKTVLGTISFKFYPWSGLLMDSPVSVNPELERTKRSYSL